ncbi:cubilin [Diorhabda sublineata]|uniref:cubilin n=1 Tax=Diorhabda sublineata TaxID=1163346 RepID=UPI0024E16371|nr:cubilin [Diorhabda sublineata]
MGSLNIYLFIIYISCSNGIKTYGDRPRIRVNNGHLQIVAAPGKNIDFVANSQSIVFINNVNVLSILKKAQTATQLTDSYQQTLTSFSDRIEALESKPFEPLPNGTHANITDQVVSRLTFRKLSRRVDLLQRRIMSIQTLLTIDDCISNPCKNGGTCQDLFSGYLCHCPPQWEGEDCSLDVNECTRFGGTDLGCQNGGICVNLVGSYRCDCINGYVGIHCMRKSIDCATAGPELCGHGTCVSHNNKDGYKCLCDPGWTTDGKNAPCTVDVNECLSTHTSCAPNVECINVPGSFYCGHCPPGFTGNGYHCTDIDECLINNGGCSSNPAVLCINTHGSRVCGPCPPGYVGNGIMCTYQGVCNINNGGCHPLATCRDSSSLGATQCICPLGYIGTGVGPNGCVRSNAPLNPCNPNPCINGRCSVNTIDGNYKCDCFKFYSGRNCETLRTDACTPNPCRNDGECQNVNNRLVCRCKTGFVGTYCQSQLQACGGYLRTDNGTLKYPSGDIQTYNHRSNCAWTIILNSTAKVIKVNITKFDIEDSPNCRNDWLEIHDGMSTAAQSRGRFCGNKIPLNGSFTSTHDSLYLWFRSDRMISKGGFELSWVAVKPVCDQTLISTSHGSIQSPGSPGHYPLNRDCHWRIIAPYDKRIMFHFFSLDIGDNKDCNADYLKFYSVLFPRDNDNIFAEFCNSSFPAPFYSPGSRVSVVFHSDNKDTYNGFQLTYSVVEGVPGCGGVFTAKEGIISSSHHGDFTICQYKIQQTAGHKIKITFNSFDLNANGGCSFNYVEIYEGPDDNSPSIGRFCGNSLPPPFTSQTHQLTIVSSSSGQTNKGWKLEYKSVCGKIYTAPSGSFSTDTSSRDSAGCIYQIERPPGNLILLFIKLNMPQRFIRYKREEGASCFLKYVEVRDGDHENSTLIGKYCGTNTVNLTSTHNFLWIKVKLRFLQSDQVSFQYTSMDVGCGGILRKKFGNIASPSHPDGYYPPGLHCKWTIIAPPTNVIQLTWMTFNVEPSYECAYDNVQIYDNNTDLGQGVLMGKFCGFTLPPMLLTSSNMMSIYFSTDVTVSMDGFLASYIFIQEKNVCGGNYFTTSGVIKSPRYPEYYPTNRECTWTINVPPGQQIMLNVTDFNIENYSGCRYDWLEIRNGGTSASPLIGKFCGSTIPKQIASHANKLYLFFKSDLSRTGHGFRITWSSTATGCGGTLTSPMGSLISPHYPEPYSRSTECIWKIITSQGSRVQVVFSDINLERHVQCLADYVELFDGLTLNSPSLARLCYEAPDPIKSTGNVMLVKFRSDVAFQGRGFQLQYTTVCRNTIKGFRGIIESPTFPNDNPQDQNCLWEIIVSDKNKINITFSHFELERSPSSSFSNRSCLYDYVELSYADPQEDFEEKRSYTTYNRYCGSQNPGHITLDSDHVLIKFVSDKLLLGSGFRLEWEIFGCGGVLTKDSGIITSPNYPKPYPVSVVCEWRIEVRFGQSIEIEFTDVDVEKDTSCDFDSISVYNGIDDTSNLLGTLCRQKQKSVISSTGNYMFIKFKSDYSYVGKGFSATYKSVPTKCGGRFTASDGYIYSPNYPKNYNRNESCEYFIDIEDGHTIEIQFDDVDLYKSDNCTRNYIKVHDGPSAAYPVLITACGNETPNKTIKSSYNNMFIEFRAHTFLTTKGFKIQYHKSCGSRITTGGNGIIQVHIDEFSEHLTTCSWTIVASDPSKHVSLTISQLQGQYYCDDEDAPLNVYNGESVESPLIGKYCGPKVPPTIVSDGSALTVFVKSQITFFATYSTFDSECGGSLTSAEGYFASPGYPKRYPSDMECEWEIKIAKGNHVSLNFIEFNLLQSDNCNTDYLEIRSFNVTGPLLGVFCGTNKPSNITHIGSLWLLFKSSKIAKGDTTITAKGFYAEYTLNEENELTGTKGEIESPLYPLSILEFKTFTWKITVTPKKRVLLSFKEFYLDARDSIDDDCYFATFEVFDGVDDTANSLGKYCGLTTPDPIKSTSNIMFIKVDYSSPRLGSKFKVEWQEVGGSMPTIPRISYKTECNNTDEVIVLTGVTNYVFTSPGYPHGYEHNLKCSWTFSTISMNHLIIQFIDIDLAHNRNRYIYLRQCDMLSDNINIYEKHIYDNDWQKIRRVCALDDAKQIIHTTNFMKLEFVTSRYMNGTGFKAKIHEGCGGLLSDPTGYIIFGNDSLRGSECQWNITVRSTKTIELVFEVFDIEHDSNKGCDNYLMIRNGKFSDSPLLGTGKYCGNTLPNKLKSTGNNLYLKYTGSSNIGGFRIKYQEVSADCGGNIILSTYDNFTEITSPNYPNIPNPHTECEWKIAAPVGEVLRVDFEERFDLTYKPGCDIEYIELRDGGTPYSTLIGRYCRSAPNSQFSTDNLIYLKFFTDTDEPKNGFKAKISISRCGGTVRGRSGEITHSSAAITKRENCTWYIVGLNDHYLNLTFVHFDLTCSKNFITLNEIPRIPGQRNNGSSLGKYCGKNPPPSIKSISNEVILTLSSDNTGTFSLKFKSSQVACGGKLTTESGVIQSPGYPIMNHYNRNCQWQITVPLGRRITLNFIDVDLNGAVKYEHGLAVFDGTYKLRLDHDIKTTGSNVTTFESSSNKMLIFFWSVSKSEHRGFKAEYNSRLPTLCQGEFGSENGVIKNPTLRNWAYNCEWTHSRSDIDQARTFAISLTMSTNTTKPVESSCLHTSGFLLVTGKEKKNVLSKICIPTVTPITIRSPFLITKLQAFVLMSATMNFTAQYNTHDCGGMVEGQSGVISSPLYPNKPSKSYECAWLVSVATGQTINVTSITLDLGDDCEKSYVVVYNGGLPTHPRIGKYCKNMKPELLISQTNQLWIEYKFDQTSIGTGFTLKYEAMSSGCGGVFHDKERFIHSPNYGSGDYPNNAECLWIIESEPGYHLQLNFIGRFNLEQSTNCSNDFIQVWSWDDEVWASLGKYCGRNIPTALTSTGERMKILFRSNDAISGSGFKAEWKWKCGGTFTADSKIRYIVSPGYPVSYRNDLKCEYTIKGKDIVNIRFRDFLLEAGDPQCKYDNLTVSSSTSPGQYVYFKNVYCGENTPEVLRVRGIVNLVFQTDAWLTRKGFKLEYRDDTCGGTITKETVIERQSLKSYTSTMRYYQPRMSCVWNITAPTNQTIILRIKKLQMYMGPMCFGQSLEIFDNFDLRREHRLSQLCGHIEKEIPIPSQTGNMAVKLEIVPSSFGEFVAEVKFSHGPAEQCGGFINLTDTKVIQSPNLANLDCAWTIVAPRDHQISIQVNNLDISSSCAAVSSNMTCFCTQLNIHDNASPLSELIERFCNRINGANPVPKILTSANNGYIRLILGGQKENAFKATLTPVPSVCGTSILTATMEKKILTSPNYESGSYPSYLKCSYSISPNTTYEKILIHFIEFNLTNEVINTGKSRQCTGDFIQIFEDPNSAAAAGLGSNAVYTGNMKQTSLIYTDTRGRHLFCGVDEIPFDYYTSGKSVTISLVSKGALPKGRGFKLEYSIPGCNRNYTELQGRIISGNYLTDCSFFITVPENRTISLYFSSFYIYASNNCSETGLEIRDGGPSEKILLTACGYRIPDPVFSSKNQLYFKVSNRRSVHYVRLFLKYDILYVSTEDGPGCGGTIYNNKGKVYSPLYPNTFRNDTVCTWVLKPPINLHIAMKFTTFDIQGTCEQANVKIETDATSVELCKNYVPGSIFRSTTLIKIIYTSSIHNGGTGWIANFQAVSSDVTDIV